MVHAFGLFAFDDVALDLTREGRAVRLEPQPARALALLVSRAGDVVTREELRQAIWGDDTHVDYDRGLAYCIGQVRTALGDSAEQPRFVQTLPRRGFRFLAPVTPAAVAAPSAEASPAGADVAAPSVPPPAAPPVTAGASVSRLRWALAGALAMLAVFAGWRQLAPAPPVTVAVSIFDNESGDAANDAFVTGLSDVVVTQLTTLAPGRVGVIGNVAALRQPRNIRNLGAVAKAVAADYVVLGQLQRQDDRLRFIVHFIRLRDGVHLSAQRFVRPGAEVRAFEADVTAEVARVVRAFVLTPSRS